MKQLLKRILIITLCFSLIISVDTRVCAKRSIDEVDAIMLNLYMTHLLDDSLEDAIDDYRDLNDDYYDALIDMSEEDNNQELTETLTDAQDDKQSKIDAYKEGAKTIRRRRGGGLRRFGRWIRGRVKNLGSGVVKVVGGTLRVSGRIVKALGKGVLVGVKTVIRSLPRDFNEAFEMAISLALTGGSVSVKNLGEIFERVAKRHLEDAVYTNVNRQLRSLAGDTPLGYALSAYVDHRYGTNITGDDQAKDQDDSLESSDDEDDEPVVDGDQVAIDDEGYTDYDDDDSEGSGAELVDTNTLSDETIVTADMVTGDYTTTYWLVDISLVPKEDLTPSEIETAEFEISEYLPDLESEIGIKHTYNEYTSVIGSQDVITVYFSGMLRTYIGSEGFEYIDFGPPTTYTDIHDGNNNLYTDISIDFYVKDGVIWMHGIAFDTTTFGHVRMNSTYEFEGYHFRD